LEDVLHRPSAKDTAPQGAQQLQAGSSDRSHLMKTLERLVLAHLRPLVSSFMDPLQFAYQPDIGVDDAVIYLLHTSLTHLEKAGSTVRIMFFDFSSAFNTIQPRLLGDKLQLAGVDHHLTSWILDYLTHRPQFVRVQGFEKFSDDSAVVVGLITDGDDREYRGLIQDFADWCLRNNLQINAGKTKELVVDFRRRSHSPPAPVSIQGTDIGISHLLQDSLLGQQHHGQGQEENGQTGEEGQLCPGMPPGLSGGGGKREDDGWKLSSLLNNTSHPLQDTLTALGSSFSERLLHPRCVKERYRRSFLPAAVRLTTQQTKCPQ
ncbi:hypothetical protein L3Q82_025509, partial [Scortum barcoo]